MPQPPLPRVLLVEDDGHIADFIRLGLANSGFDVAVAADGQAALNDFQRQRPALVLLDLRLPLLSGDEVCRRIRGQSNVPILVLTARDEVAEKVRLLGLGADDYLVKPFEFQELLARAHALLRRVGHSPHGPLTFLDIELLPTTREVLRNGAPVTLTGKEFDLLQLFMSNPRTVLAKEMILERLWGESYTGDDNVVEVYVLHLRRKLGEPLVIQTVRGLGYSLRG